MKSHICHSMKELRCSTACSKLARRAERCPRKSLRMIVCLQPKPMQFSSYDVKGQHYLKFRIANILQSVSDQNDTLSQTGFAGPSYVPYPIPYNAVELLV
jgi:hypothetical protein